jgi:hypothetical protein
MQTHLDRSNRGRPNDGGGPIELRPQHMYHCDIYISERQRGVDRKPKKHKTRQHIEKPRPDIQESAIGSSPN